MRYMAGFIVLYLATHISLCLYLRRRLSVSLAYEAEEEQGFRVLVHIRNNGYLPLLCGVVPVRAWNRITGRKETQSHRICIGPRRERTLEILVKDSLCGGVEVSVDEIRLCDFLGVIGLKATASGQITLYVYPQFFDLVCEREGGVYDMESYRYSAEKKGSDSSDTFGIAAYKPGDLRKQIHWKLSGKLGELMIREASLPIESRVMLMIDKSVDENAQFGWEERSRASAFAASLSHSMLRRGITHRVGWMDEESRKWKSFQVKEEEDFFEMLHMLLLGPFTTQGASVIGCFEELEEDKQCSDYILVANRDMDTERLRRYGTVTMYRTDRKEAYDS